MLRVGITRSKVIGGSPFFLVLELWWGAIGTTTFNYIAASVGVWLLNDTVFEVGRVSAIRFRVAQLSRWVAVVWRNFLLKRILSLSINILMILMQLILYVLNSCSVALLMCSIFRLFFRERLIVPKHRWHAFNQSAIICVVLCIESNIFTSFPRCQPNSAVQRIVCQRLRQNWILSPYLRKKKRSEVRGSSMPVALEITSQYHSM